MGRLRKLILPFLLLCICQFCFCQTWVDLGGGSAGEDLNFHAGATAQVLKNAAFRAHYFYSNNGEIFSLSAGPIVYNSDRFKLLVLFGTELNNDTEPKLSVLSWFRIRDGLYAQAGAESVADRAYYSAGLVLRFVLNKDKTAKRFF